MNPEGIIHEVQVGSRLHGVIVEGTDDDDRMGTYVPTPRRVLGLGEAKTHVYRDGGAHSKLGKDDKDYVWYPIQKYVSLVVKGNPSVLQTLYAPPHQQFVLSRWGDALMAGLATFGVSQQAAPRYLGYLTSQRHGLLGTRSPSVKRPELVRAYGYDTKFAFHAIRLGYQGVEFLTHGKITFPMVEQDRNYLLDVRTANGVSLDNVIEAIDYQREKLRKFVDGEEKSPLPLEPNYVVADQMLIDIQVDYWESNNLL